MPHLFTFYIENLADCNVKLSETEQFLFQNFIMFLCMKEQKFKRKRMSKYSLMNIGAHELDDDFLDLKDASNLRKCIRFKHSGFSNH